MATHSSVLAWRIPGTGEPGGLPSMGLHRVGHDWSDLAEHRYFYAFYICWRFEYLYTQLLKWTFLYIPPFVSQRTLLLRYNWHVTLCYFQLYSIMFWRLYILENDYHKKSSSFFFFFFICSEFCHTLEWNSHGFTCVPHPDPPSHLPLHPLPLGFPSVPGPSACLMHPTWAGDLFHPRYYTCFDAVLLKHPTLSFSHRV